MSRKPEWVESSITAGIGLSAGTASVGCAHGYDHAQELHPPRRCASLLASHVVTEDVGRIAAEAAVKTPVLSHLVPGDDPSITDAMWTEGVRKHYSGTIVVGRDLLEV